MSRIVERVFKFVLFLITADWFSPNIVSNLFCCRFLRVAVYPSVVCNVFFITFLYIKDMIPVLEVAPMVPSFPQES